MNISDKRFAALSVFYAQTIEDKRSCLNTNWSHFMTYMLPPPCDHENDMVEWTEDRFEALYKAATRWIIVDLMARVETLEGN